jgi:hypothetical protein
VCGFGLDFEGLEFEDPFFEGLGLEFEVFPFGEELAALGLGLLDDLVGPLDLVGESLHFAHERDVLLLGLSQLFEDSLTLLSGFGEQSLGLFLFLTDDELILGLFLLEF